MFSSKGRGGASGTPVASRQGHKPGEEQDWSSLQTQGEGQDWSGRQIRADLLGRSILALVIYSLWMVGFFKRGYKRNEEEVQQDSWDYVPKNESIS